MRRLGLVISDLHIGSAHVKGRINIYDDFKEDERLAQLLERYSTGEYGDDEVHLVLNGDIFDLLKVPVLGRFPDAISERLAKLKLYKCIRGHPRVISAFTQFLVNGRNVIHYQPGNHDMELHFPGAQRVFCRALTGEDTHPRIKFLTSEPFFTLDGVQFHHGHQFEALHAMDFKRLVLPRPGREPILNLPWGSLFVRARFNPNWWQKRPFDKLTKFLRNDITFFERLDRYAGRILKGSRSIHAVFMGHTHVPQVRTWPVNKLYVNTGTWMPMVGLGIGHLGQHIELHYGFIEWGEDGPRASLHRWHGKRPETEEIIS